jgi:hypothetical protein
VTDAEWMACTDPQVMAHYLAGKASDRKVRLLALVCCRRVAERIPDWPWNARPPRREGPGSYPEGGEPMSAAHDLVEAEALPHFFADLTMPVIAGALGLSLATVERYWTFPGSTPS